MSQRHRQGSHASSRPHWWPSQHKIRGAFQLQSTPINSHPKCFGKETQDLHQLDEKIKVQCRWLEDRGVHSAHCSVKRLWKEPERFQRLEPAALCKWAESSCFSEEVACVTDCHSIAALGILESAVRTPCDDCGLWWCVARCAITSCV